ncbi:RagB/SusD family nutrient uptake outer membrane protein [Pedobacter steynii]|uniref:SusD family protein n=1 Tax=Pedobacter steynii TaxID=430522 RepID=A0A1D7QBJ4_9SPHI|nr:RagB/SusD family nutrient uptake outer membrane protein [Pedobacter steynii]AOM76070.1 hypothetical protein BFS30_02140 [Pedobacter steynii]
MKTFPTLLSGILLGLMLLSCQKFVAIKKNSSQAFLVTAEDCQLMLDNYTTMNTGYPLDGEISSDDYYITDASYQLASIPQEEKNLYTWNPSAQRMSAVPNWLNPYKTVYNANLVLQTLDKLQGKGDDPVLLNNLRGAALFYRAYCFWNIAQLYARPYRAATARQDPGIPLRLDADINGTSVRGSVQDTYDRILQDLHEAVNLLANTSSIATRPNRRAAFAMLSRTYLSMGDYPNALINANAALQINNQLLDYNSADVNKHSDRPFQRFHIEVIFHTINYNQSFAPVAGPILSTGFGGFNNVAKIDPVLAASYAPNDLRSKVFIKENFNDMGEPDGTFRFSGNYEPAFFATLFTGLAVDEIYLIRAECYARTGNQDAAMQDLNALLSKRWLTGTYTNMTAATADEALTKVLVERRKELLMRGLRWSDLRRLNKSIIRKVTSGATPNQTITTYTLPAGDPRYTLLFPKEVMDNSSMDQNIR